MMGRAPRSSSSGATVDVVYMHRPATADVVATTADIS
jgi:hypothetical protein